MRWKDDVENNEKLYEKHLYSSCDDDNDDKL